MGLTDIALVYPLAVIATRRENGMSLRAALAARNLHSGGWTAGTLLVPYSVLVESMSQYLNSMNAESGGPQGAGSNGQLRMFAAAGATSLVASIGVQPIEKKLTMDQMLESEAARRAVAARYPGQPNPLLTPLREIAAYTQAEGVAALFGGFLPLYVVANLRGRLHLTSCTPRRSVASVFGRVLAFATWHTCASICELRDLNYARMQAYTRVHLHCRDHCCKPDRHKVCVRTHACLQIFWTGRSGRTVGEAWPPRPLCVWRWLHCGCSLSAVPNDERTHEV